MSQTVNSTNGYNLPKVELNKDNVQQTIAKSSQVVSDSFENNAAVKTISSSADTGGFAQAAPLVPLLMVVDKGLDRLMGGDSSKSILHKAARLGNKISDALNLEKFISEDKINGFKKKLSENRFTKYFTNEYKANPICSLAKPTPLAQTLSDKLDTEAQKLLSFFKDVKYNPDAIKTLRDKGTISANTMKFIDDVGPLTKRLTPDFLTTVTSVMDELSGIATKDTKSITILKENIGKFLAGAEDVTELGLSEQLSSFFSKFADGKYAGTTISLSDDAAKVISTVSKKEFSTKQILDVVDDLVSNGINIEGNSALQTARNKHMAATGKIGRTTLGKSFAKGVVKAKDIATYGGGIISLFFMASSIMNAIKATKEAPKGEKKATFMHVLSEQYLGMILFQPSINLVYKAAGNKYRGMSVEGRKALADLIAKTNADETLTKEGLKIAKLQRKLLVKGVDEKKVIELAGKSIDEAKTIAKSLKGEGAKLKFWEKPLKAMGTLLSTGLDKMKIPKFINVAGKKIKIPQPTFKGFVGGLGRFLLIMMVVQPLIQKPITKLCHKIFGEPKSYLAKQNQDKKTGDETTTQDIKTFESEQIKTDTPSFNINQAKETNLLKKWSKTPTEDETMATTSISQEASQAKNNPNNGEIAALNIFKKKEERYIPSIEPFIPQDNSEELNAKVNSIIKNTDAVVAKTKKYL